MYICLPLLLVSTVFVACGGPPKLPQISWENPGKGAEVLATDRYECIKEARTPWTKVGRYGATDTIVTDEALFRACMEARGWRSQVAR